MALGDIGLFNPAESAYQTPGAYEATLRADAVKRAEYLAAMDQFYEQLDETKRQFDETLGFKEAELAQSKWIAEEQIGLGKEELSLKGELGRADIALRTKALEAEQEYRTEELAVKRMAIGAEYGGDPSRAYDILERYLLGGEKETGYIPGTSYAPGISEPFKKSAGSTVRSGEVSLYDPGAPEYA